MVMTWPPEILVVPEALCGHHAAAKRAWTSVVRAAFKKRDWGSVAASLQLMEIDCSQIPIELYGPTTAWDDEHFLAYLVVETIVSHAYKVIEVRQEKYDVIQQLVFSGVKDLWFSIGLLATPRDVLDTMKSHSDNASTAKALVRSLLRWWPQLCDLEPAYRFRGIEAGWGIWGGKIRRWCHFAGMSMSDVEELSAIGPIDSGIRITNWLAMDETASGGAEPAL